MKLIKEDKYFFYNKEKKLLVFKRLQENGVEQMIVPQFTKDDLNLSSEEIKQLNCQLLSLLLDEGARILFNSVRSRKTVSNNKLKKVDVVLEKNYYGAYKVLTDEEVKQLDNICFCAGLKPHYISIDKLIEEQYSQNVYLDEECVNSLDELGQIKL